MIALKHEHDDYMRRANVKVAVLKEVIDRLYKGEDVDVEGMLGVGDEREEKSWEEGMLFGNIFMGIMPNDALCIVLQEIEEEDAIWQAKSRKNQKQSPGDSVSEGGAGVGAVLGLTKYSEAEKADEHRATRQPQSARDYGA